MRLDKVNNIIYIISIFLLLTIFIQITLGAWIRLTGSGMSCPDWPLCYGMFIPTYSKIILLENISYSYYQIFLEWIHRANAAILIGPLCLILSSIIIFNKSLSISFKKLSYALLVLLMIQGLLGGLTVFKSNIPWSVAIHLICAFLLFYVVLNIILNISINEKNFLYIKNNIRVNIILSGIIAMITASLGSFTSKYGASLSCSKWPKCNDSLFPNISSSFEVIHFSHRLLAFILIIFLVLIFYKLFKYLSKMSDFFKIIYLLIPGIILLQVLVGALLIYFEVPIWMGVFHQASGLLLFSLISIMLFYTKTKQ